MNEWKDSCRVLALVCTYRQFRIYVYYVALTFPLICLQGLIFKLDISSPVSQSFCCYAEGGFVVTVVKTYTSL